MLLDERCARAMSILELQQPITRVERKRPMASASGLSMVMLKPCACCCDWRKNPFPKWEQPALPIRSRAIRYQSHGNAPRSGTADAGPRSSRMARTPFRRGCRGEGRIAGKTEFEEALLFTHRGLSGPAILQVSSYWREGEDIRLRLRPISTFWSA